MIAWKQFSGRLRSMAEMARNDAGGTIVEMAISSVILFSMVFAVFEVTMACYTYNAVSQAARETARWGMVRGTKCSTYTPGQDHCGATRANLEDHAKASTAINWSVCTTSNPCLTATYLKGTTVSGSSTSTSWATCAGGCSADPGNLLVVTITYPYALTVPMVNTFNINLTSTSQVVVSQ